MPDSIKTPRWMFEASQRDLTVREQTPPLGPSKEYATTCTWQVSCSPKRKCLLKGCEKLFPPATCYQRYCSPECARAAQRWAQNRANRRYRATQNGKCRRREQACRYRERARERRKREQTSPESGREGYRRQLPDGFFSCLRPGCYQAFPVSFRSPDRKFCCASCRNALRRVLRRERYWRRKLRREFRNHEVSPDTS